MKKTILFYLFTLSIFSTVLNATFAEQLIHELRNNFEYCSLDRTNDKVKIEFFIDNNIRQLVLTNVPLDSNENNILDFLQKVQPHHLNNIQSGNLNQNGHTIHYMYASIHYTH